MHKGNIEKKPPGTVGHACNPGTQAAEVEGSSTWGYIVRSDLEKKNSPLDSMEKLTHGIFFRVADFHPENVVQEPVNGFLLIKHKDELHNQSKVWRLKHFS